MPSLEEAMRQSEDGIEQLDDGLITPVNDVFMINPETRTISVPLSERLFGVNFDKDVEKKYFKCPKIVGNNIDLSKHKIYVVYQKADENITTLMGEVGKYWCEDVKVDETGDYIEFSWLLSGNVLEEQGFIAFKVVAVYTDTETGELKTRWNTVPSVGLVRFTLSDGEEITEQYADVITQLLQRMDVVEDITTPEAMKGYVEQYFNEHPIELDETLTDSKKAAPANLVGQIKEDFVKKIDKPSISDNGKTPRAKNGNVEWVEQGLPSDAQTETAVNNWLDKHPEATTTVLDESLTFDKFSKDTRAKSNNKYLNMVEFGCDNTGQTDVTDKIYIAVNKGYKNLYFPRGKYLFSVGNRFTLPIGGSIIGDMGLGYGTEEVDEGNLTWFIVTQTNNPIRMQHASELKFIAFYYPKQTEEFGIDYEPSITCVSSAKSCVVDSCFFKNSKTAISFDVTNGSVYITRNIGNPLHGIIIKNQVDLSYIMENHFGGTYNKDRTEVTAKYINENGIAYQIGRADWSKVGSFCYGYKIGFYLIDSEDTLLDGCGADGCITGFILDGTSRVKMIGCTATGFSKRDDSNSLGECLVIRDTHKTKIRDYNQILGCSFFSSRKTQLTYMEYQE